jgi:hypothetical protein
MRGAWCRMGDTGFTPGRDHALALRLSITRSMKSAVDRKSTESNASDLHLLRDCLALGRPVRRRAPAKVRLEAELGPELAQRLVSSLSAAPRRPA